MNRFQFGLKLSLIFENIKLKEMQDKTKKFQFRESYSWTLLPIRN